HLVWYTRTLPGGAALRQVIHSAQDSATQWRAVADYLDALAARMDRLPAPGDACPNDINIATTEGLAA
ncbi:MAG: tRNA dihydrouridine synthase DusB, partial [Burkholderiaceae bacterium]